MALGKQVLNESTVREWCKRFGSETEVLETSKKVWIQGTRTHRCNEKDFYESLELERIVELQPKYCERKY